MSDFHFPTLVLSPQFDGQVIERGNFSFAKRKWETSTFDLATLATRHKLHLPYQMMDVFLSMCNGEICVKNQASFDDAVQRLKSLQISLYGCGVSPFVTPFGTTHSVNEYSGINSRDSETLRCKLHPDMQNGLTSDTATVEAWPIDLSFQCVVVPSRLAVTEDGFVKACEKADLWHPMIKSHEKLHGFSDAVQSTTMMSSLSQSILHMWCAIESLFPNVVAELSFRVSLLLSQIVSQGASRRTYFDKIKKGYNIRSKIAHGSKHDATIDEWKEAWEIVMDTFNALVAKGVLPTEDALLADLLS